MVENAACFGGLVSERDEVTTEDSGELGSGSAFENVRVHDPGQGNGPASDRRGLVIADNPTQKFAQDLPEQSEVCLGRFLFGFAKGTTQKLPVKFNEARGVWVDVFDLSQDVARSEQLIFTPG